MNSFGRWVVGFSFILATVQGCFSYREGDLQLPLMAMYLVWLGFVFAALIRLPSDCGMPWYVSAALLICPMAAPFLGGRVGERIRDMVFRSRLAEYAAAANAARAGDAPAVIPRLAYRIAHNATSTGGDEVAFFWGHGIPVKHTAFVHRTGQPWNDVKFTKAWSSIRSVAPDWYVVSD